MRRAIWRSVQSAICPGGNLDELGPPSASGFRISAEQRGAGGSLGGDFYTLSVRAPGRIGVVIGDACGSGAVGAAQVARIYPRMRELALSGLMPAALLADLNRTVLAELPLDRFVTAAALELDVRAGTLTIASAGHVPAILRRAGNVSILGRASGAPLGFSRQSTYTDELHPLERRDVIVLMTDGVLEAVEPDLYDMKTLLGFVARTTVGAAGVHRLLLQKFEECTGGRAADDMTLLTLEPEAEPRASRSRSTLGTGSYAAPPA